MPKLQRFHLLAISGIIVLSVGCSKTTFVQKGYIEADRDRNSDKVFANAPIFTSTNESWIEPNHRLLEYQGPYQTYVGISGKGFQSIESVNLTMTVNGGTQQSLPVDLDALNRSVSLNYGHWVFKSPLIPLNLDWETAKVVEMRIFYVVSIDGVKHQLEKIETYSRSHDETTWSHF